MDDAQLVFRARPQAKLADLHTATAIPRLVHSVTREMRTRLSSLVGGKDALINPCRKQGGTGSQHLAGLPCQSYSVLLSRATDLRRAPCTERFGRRS